MTAHDAEPATSSPENHVETIDEAIDGLLKLAGATKQRTLVRRIIETALGLAADGASRLNVKISAAALSEMRTAFKLFAPYSGFKKATIFGSARTKPGDPLYSAAEQCARELSDDGWMVVTGAGPGIMEAAATGAGEEHSLGVSIRLPFEEEPNALVANDQRHVSMKYFFTRKLMLVKEASAFICLPGGFGTLDETFELLTLQQTGKMAPAPIVLLDKPGGTYWRALNDFVEAELERGGYVVKGDLDRVLITDSAEAAVAHVHAFWSNYVDLRWFPSRVAGERDALRLYLKIAPDAVQLASLNERFGHTLASGAITVADPHPEEGGEYAGLARVRLIPDPHKIGELYRLIGALNEL